MNVADALSGRAGLEGILWMLAGAPRRALRRELGALLPATDALGPQRLRHARLRPGRKLIAYYEVRVRAEGGEYRPRPIAVTWTLEAGPDRDHNTTADFAALQAEAARLGVAQPFRELAAEVPAWGMRVLVSPLDPRFGQLVRLSDPGYVGDKLARAYAPNPKAPYPFRPRACAVTPIRYRPGKRHVLRYDCLDGARRATVFAKLYTGDRGALVFRVANQAADWLAEHADGVTSVRPLAYVPEDAVVFYPRAPGAPLFEHLRRPCRDAAGCLERAGAALRVLHDLPEPPAGSLQIHDFTAEIEEIAMASNHIAVLIPPVGTAIEALLDHARGLHERLPLEPPTFTHGDFKCEHLWIAQGRLTLIDFDTCRLADPALDIGKFLADLQLWYAAYDRSGVEQAQEKFLAGYAPGAPSGRLIRARLYEAVELVKMTARRVPLYERDWARRTERLVRRAQAVMNELQRALGLPSSHPSLHCSAGMFQGSPHIRGGRGHQSSARGGRD